MIATDYIFGKGQPSNPLGGAFIATFDTTKAGSTGANQLNFGQLISPSSTATLNLSVEWGDGTITSTTDRLDPNLTHTYSTGSLKTITVTGSNFDIRANVGDNKKLIRIDQCGIMRVQFDYGFWFSTCSNLEYIHTDFNTTGATNMTRAFDSCTKLLTLPVFDTSQVTNFNQAFYLNRFTSVPAIDTSNGLVFDQMFRNNTASIISNFPLLDLRKMTSGYLFAFNSGMPASVYTQLLINTEANNPNTGTIRLHGGNSKYNNTATSARNALIARGWIIEDGGLAA